MRKWYGYLVVVMVLGMFCGIARAEPGDEAKVLIQEWNVLQQEKVRLDDESTEIAKLESDLNTRLAALKKMEAALKVEETQIKSDKAAQAWMQKSIAAQDERKAIMDGTFVRVEKRTKLLADTAAYSTKKQDWLRRAQLFILTYAPEDMKKGSEVNVNCADVNDSVVARTCLRQYWSEADGVPVSQPASPK